MDDADRAFRSDQWIMKAALQERKHEGPRPTVVSLCLNCDEVIERVPATPEGVKNAKRWCCAQCRDEWQKEHEDE